MADILEEIIAVKKSEVEAGKRRQSLENLAACVESMPRCRNFFRAVSKPGAGRVNIIAEVKKASPSAGLIRSDFDPQAIALTYQKCGAAAISVLTDEKYFQGSLDHLRLVSDSVGIPVLRKDFIIDPWQVYQSRAAGADAILLIAEALPLGRLSDLMILAAELTLTVLLEVHRADTLLSVRSMVGFPKAGYSILGINNRDLATMKVDINTTVRLAGLAGEGVPLVAESGIKTRADVEKVRACGACAVLVGQALCASESIEQKYRELFG